MAPEAESTAAAVEEENEKLRDIAGETIANLNMLVAQVTWLRDRAAAHFDELTLGEPR